MSRISDPIRERISARHLTSEILSQLSECTLLLEGSRGALHALNSNIHSDRMRDERLSATLWLIERQLATVQGVIEEALQVPGGCDE